MARPFHLAFPVRDLESTREFYAGVLGCRLGRSGADWQDIDFFGSQIVAHLVDGGMCFPVMGQNEINGEPVPIPHFGAVLTMSEWRSLCEQLQAQDADLLMPPHVRYEREVNEQASVFVRDPSGNVIEFKAFADESRLFARAE